MALLENVIARGLHSARPSAGSKGVIYTESDTGRNYRDNGTGWDDIGPEQQLDYVQATGTVNVTATTEGAATALITGSAITYDGSTDVLIEFFAPQCHASSTLGHALTIVLYDGSASIGQIGLMVNPGAGDFYMPLHCSRRLTPSAATHTYSIRAYETAGAGHIYMGTGGSGNLVPGFMRISRAA